MRGDGNNQQIGERYALDYYRRPWATRVWKSRWNWSALGLSLLAVVVLYAWQRERAFYAAPVSSVHASFGTSCAECHDRNWQTAMRLVVLDDRHHSVSDAACRRCHDAADHPAGTTPAPACAACHQEHRPHRDLAAVADQRCTSCHVDLDSRVEHESGPTFHASVTSFGEDLEGHPEFALLRNDLVSPRRQLGLAAIAAFASQEHGGESHGWRDRGGLKFNHQFHLAEAGVVDAQRKNVVLQCADCHQPQGDGAYMAPMSYEQHCARCHPLRLGGDLAAVGGVPHESPEQIRGVLRERLANLSVEPTESAPTAARIPLLPKPIGVPDDAVERVNDALARADNALFGPAAGGGCRHCHHVEPEGQTWVVRPFNPEFGLGDEGAPSGEQSASMVPDRWFQHGKFDHEQHRAVQCAVCHAAAQSSEAADILLPSIAVCRECHGRTPAGGSATVRADCVLCHKYHGDSGPFEGVLLEELVAATRRQPRASAASAGEHGAGTAQ